MHKPNNKCPKSDGTMTIFILFFTHITSIPIELGAVEQLLCCKKVREKHTNTIEVHQNGGWYNTDNINHVSIIAKTGKKIQRLAWRETRNVFIERQLVRW